MKRSGTHCALSVHPSGRANSDLGLAEADAGSFGMIQSPPGWFLGAVGPWPEPA